MKIAVDGRGYGTAARVLRAGNHAAADQHGRLVAGLAAYGGMAGDDATSVEFARSYDAAAQAAVDGLADVVDAFATLAHLTRQSHRNHQHANLAAVFGHPAPDPASMDFEPGTVSVGACVVPSALGSNAVDLPPLWEHVVDRLEGYAWPDADTGRLRSATALWRASAEYVERLVPSCGSAVAQLETQRSPEVPLALQALHDLTTSLSGLAVEMLAIGDACGQYAAAVEEHRAVVRGILTDLAFEAGLTIVAGTVIGFVTLGGGAVAGGAIAGWRIVAAARKVLVTLRALRDLHRARAVARLTEVVDRIGPLRRVLLRLKRGRRLKAVPRTIHRTGERLESADLSAAQQANLARHLRRMPIGAGPTVVTRGADGCVVLTTRVPGRVPGSYAIYEKVVDAAGTTIRVTKTTVAPDGTIVHIKNKLTP